MSAEEFWKDDPQLFYSYRTSFINKKKREMEEADYKSWLQGLYIHDGNGKLVYTLEQFLGNMVSKNKNNKKIDSYPEIPYFEKAKLGRKEEKQKLEKQANKYKDYENSLVYYGTLKQQYLEKLKKGE